MRLVEAGFHNVNYRVLTGTNEAEFSTAADFHTDVYHACLKIMRFDGFDHGVGHPLLLLHDAKAPSCRKNKAFKGLGHYSEWPKVADAAIKAGLIIKER